MTSDIGEKTDPDYTYTGCWVAASKWANGIGRTISKTYGIYEGQFVDGQPKGWGSVIDPALNHYEGYVTMTSTGAIVGHGAGTLMTGDKTIKGIWENGKLKTPADKDNAPKGMICVFKQSFKSVTTVKAAAASSSAPAASKAAPAAGAKTPAAGATTPAAGAKTPAAGAKTPAAGATTPAAGTKAK